MNKNLILTKMFINQCSVRAHVIPISELKHEVFDRTVCYS